MQGLESGVQDPASGLNFMLPTRPSGTVERFEDVNREEDIPGIFR